MEQDVRYLIALLETPVESDKTDYKSAIEFKENEDFSIRLVKHILGFANSGGGHIIIGFCEEGPDKTLKIDENLNDNVISSYEVTRVCQYVNSILGSQENSSPALRRVRHNFYFSPPNCCAIIYRQ